MKGRGEMAVSSYYSLTPEQKKARIAQVSTPQAQTAQYNSAIANPATTTTTGMGATTNPTGYNPPVAGSQQSAQAYINKEGNPYGGLSGYTANQQNRFNDASASGDTELLGKLNADASRVGYSFKPYQPVQQTAQVQQGYTPQDAVTSVRNSSQLQQQSGDSLAIERAALKNAIDTQMSSIKNNAGYANQLTNDSRVLQDFERSNKVNPFSGRTSYDSAMIGRGRDIDDSARNSELTNKMNSLSTEMSDFDKLSPERQRGIFNELLQLERNFGLNQAQVTGEYGGKQTMAAKNADRDFALNESGVTGQYKGVQTQQSQNQQFNQNMATQQLERSNFESDRSYDFAKGQQEWSNAFQQGQFDFNKAQTAWENTFKSNSFQQDMKEAAASRGLQWAGLAQRDQQFVAEQAFRDKQFQWGKDMDIANTWQKTREMDLAEKKLNTTEKSTYNEAMQKAIDLALKDVSFASAKDETAKNKIIDSYYNKLTSGIGMADSEIEQYLK